MFLPDEDLFALTGLQRPSAIRRWLDTRGIPYEVTATGRPRVLESVIITRLGGASPARSPEPRLRLRNA